MGADKPGFAVSKLYIGFRDLCRASAQTLDLPAFEHKTGLKLLLDEVIVTRFAVDSDHAIAAGFGFF